MISKERKRKLEKNIWKFYLYRFFCAWFFFAPIFVLFFQDLGFSMTQIMIMESCFTLVVVLTLIPSGIIGDHLGRKNLLVINTLFFVSGAIIIATSSTYIMFIIAYILFGLSSATWAASGTPFFFDNLKELDREKDFKKLYGNVTAINYLIGGLGALAGGYIATFDMRLTFWATAIAMALAFITAFTFTDTKLYKHGDKRYFNHLKDAIRFASKHPRVRMLIIFSAIFWGAMFSAHMLYQPYFKSLGIPIVYFGVIYLMLYVLGGLSAKLTHRIEKHLSENEILLLIGAFSIISVMSLMFNVVIIGIIAAMIMFVIWGVFDTVIADYIHKHVESSHRSTVHSLNMLSSELVMTMLGPFVGWLVDFWSLTTAFMFSAGLLTANIVILTIALNIAKKKG